MKGPVGKQSVYLYLSIEFAREPHSEKNPSRLLSDFFFVWSVNYLVNLRRGRPSVCRRQRLARNNFSSSFPFSPLSLASFPGLSPILASFSVDQSV